MLRSSAVLSLAVLFSLGEGYNHHHHNYYYHDETEKIDSGAEENTLIQAHIIFRHGDRTPDVSTIYPTDPYVNETYYPFGRGQLTQSGKERAYKLGVSLRRRYNNFLGPLYHSQILEATSSAYPRTQMTLQLVLAGLFPPKDEDKVDYDLNWQPIPYTYSSFAQDKLIATFRSCEKIFDIANELEKTETYQKNLKQFNRLYQYLSQYSGWDVNGTQLLFNIQNTLKTEEEWGLKLPEWVDMVWPGPMRTASSYFWRVLSSTVQLRRLSIGNLLKKVIVDSMKKAQGELPDQKITLYSGHDFTIVPLLAALGNYDGSHTPYTAHIIFELHNINNVYGFKIFFQDYSKTTPQLLSIPMCGSFCSLKKFTDLMRDHLPGENWCS